jgi:[acyl-carrier-protein] S-malonyltransferase
MDNQIRADLIRDRLATTAFAFRGYNNTNLGRTAELLEHRVYGPVLERYLREDSEACSTATGRKFDLVARVRSRQESSLETFAEDIPLIVAVERAHIALLKEFFDIDYRRARLALGYSIGEIAALVCSGVYTMPDLLRPLLYLSDDCVELAKTVTMGVVFSRGPALDLDAILRLCTRITAESHGVIDMSSHLAPNTVLLLGQNETINRFKELMPEALGKQIHLRKNSYKWPPLHTSILWSRNLSNRAAAIMQTVTGGFVAPVPPVLSMVNGKVAYNDYNSRSLMNRWVDHPQRMWDCINELLTMGIDLILHVGPEPNLLPATFQRISENVNAQVNRWSLKSSLGRRAVMGIVRRPWLAKVITSKAAILRTPFVAHVVVEDWLLAQDVK